MLARSTKLFHPLGVQIETPLLVPSFSSKGFAFKNSGESESSDALKVSKEFLTETLLVSGYDLHHKCIPYSDDILCTETTFIDSGGYETSELYDLSATTKYSFPIKTWTLNMLEGVLDAWPKHKAAIIVSYDHGDERNELDKQIDDANKLFSKYNDFIGDFLIKPETTSQFYIQIDSVIRSIGKLADFKIIGVTEKELGNSILQRMKNLAKIRHGLFLEVSIPLPQSYTFWRGLKYLTA